MQRMLSPGEGHGIHMEDMLRVCLLNDSFPPLIDGVANAVVNYAGVLNKKGQDVQVAVPAYPGAEDKYPYPVVRYKSLDTTRLVGYRAGNPFDPEAREKILSRSPALLHSHCPMISTYLARNLREVCGAPLILTYHTKFDIDIARAVKSKLLQEQSIKALVENISSCDEVWVVSRGAGENLKSLGYTGGYTVMENGVDFTRGRASEEVVEALRQKHRIPPETPVFLYVGRMMWYKGVRITLAALRKLYEAEKDFRMIFVGDGADREEMELYAKDLGIGDKCLFTGAVRDRELLRVYFCLGDLFLFPSTFDTNGIVVREAAACALGSVLIKGSCAAEGITDGENGLLIEENPQSMADRLLWAYENRGAALAIGRSAQKEIYCSWEESVGRAMKQYREILKKQALGLYEKRRRAPTDETLAGLARFSTEYDKARQSLFAAEHSLEMKTLELQVQMEAAADSFSGDMERMKALLQKKIRQSMDQLSDIVDRYL